MFKYRLYKTLRFFHLISKKKFKKKTAKYSIDYRLINKSRFFDSKWYKKNYPDVLGNPIVHYLTEGWQKGYQPSSKFDGNGYLEEYPDVKEAQMNPLVHYERFGKQEKRRLCFCEQQLTLTFYEKSILKLLKILKKTHLISYAKYELLTKKFRYNDYRAIYKSKLFNKKYYCKKYIDNNFIDAIEHYLHIGFKLGYNPSPKFDNDFYLTNNPDILLAEINPLFHYETSGKFENRQISVVTNNSKMRYETIKGDVLLFTHELSLTGAPIALLNMTKILKANNLNPIILSPKSGELEAELNAAQINYIVDPHLLVRFYRQDNNLQKFLSSFEIILFNTIDTLKFAQYIKTNNRKICWVHEGEFGYRCAESAFDIQKSFNNINEVYSVGNYSKSFTDKYISPEKSKILLYGIEDTLIDHPKHRNNEMLTFGIFGVCSERKGTDLFVEAIKRLPRKIKNSCAFKIIGRIDDNEFCDNLKKAAQNENIIFTGQLSHDDTLKEMENLDVVVCPSLDDPMPIVCTEAMLLKKVVICSNKTGTASFIKNGINGYIYNIENDNLSQIIIDAYDNKSQFNNLGNKWHQIYLDNFTNDIFEKNIRTIFSDAKIPTNDDIFKLLCSISNKINHLCLNLGANK